MARTNREAYAMTSDPEDLDEEDLAHVDAGAPGVPIPYPTGTATAKKTGGAILQFDEADSLKAPATNKPDQPRSER
ncbi:MAG: hypothetical protein AAGI70_02240 [Pseudomonadota bacterium]